MIDVSVRQHHIVRFPFDKPFDDRLIVAYARAAIYAKRALAAHDHEHCRKVVFVDFIDFRRDFLHVIIFQLGF